jgi:hypothetical protein
MAYMLKPYTSMKKSSDMTLPLLKIGEKPSLLLLTQAVSNWRRVAGENYFFPQHGINLCWIGIHRSYFFLTSSIFFILEGF